MNFGGHFISVYLVMRLLFFLGVLANRLFDGLFRVGHDRIAFGGVDLALMLLIAGGQVVETDVSAEGFRGSLGRLLGEPVEQIGIS
jgi:hypothetical protein